MDANVQEMVNVLSAQRILYTEMLRLAREKTELLKNREIDKLDELVKQEQGMLLRMGAIEKKRAAAAHTLAGATGIKESALTFSAVLELIPQDERHYAAEIYSSLSATLKALAECNDINIRMIEINLDSINFVLGRVTGEAQQNNYQGSGARVEQELPKGPSFLDSKA